MQYHIEQLRLCTSSDFAAAALPIDDGWKYRWRAVSGSRNERYKQMIVKRGKGLAGNALLFGRTVVSDERTIRQEDSRPDCPLMLAEGLLAAVAAPLPLAGREEDMQAIVLLGRRSVHRYSADELQYLQACVKRFVGLPFFERSFFAFD